jgi:hypothetical protein
VAKIITTETFSRINAILYSAVRLATRIHTPLALDRWTSAQLKQNTVRIENAQTGTDPQAASFTGFLSELRCHLSGLVTQVYTVGGRLLVAGHRLTEARLIIKPTF